MIEPHQPWVHVVSLSPSLGPDHCPLQGECVLLTREFLGNTMKLEEDLDQLRTKAAASEEAREAAEAELEKQEESPRSQAAPKK